MASSDKDGYPDGCYLCDGPAGTLHHVSYQPEVVVLVCSHCHGVVHSSDYSGQPVHPELAPDMARSEWVARRPDLRGKKRPTLNQIRWYKDNIGVVQR